MKTNIKIMMTMVLMLIIASFQTFADNRYEAGMQKGLGLLEKATTPDAAVEATNHFERIAAANPSEWLPLYYAAYSSLKTGFLTEGTTVKDDWYQKGLVFIERAKTIKQNDSEILSMEGYLRLMYISNDVAKRAQEQTGQAIALLEQAKAIDPTNPRPWFIHGQNTLFTPAFFGGGPAVAKPLLEKANELFAVHHPANALMPAWGKMQCEKLLARCNEAKN